MSEYKNTENAEPLNSAEVQMPEDMECQPDVIEMQKSAEAESGLADAAAYTSEVRPGYEEFLARIQMAESISQESGRRKKKGRFGLGFLSGFMTAVVCVGLCGIGWTMADIGIRHKQETEKINEGAAVLTSEETLYRLAEVQAILEEYALEEVDSEHLSSYLFKGLAVGTDDPYADYYTAAELQSLMDSSIGEYHGIGATLSEDLRTGEITVIQVYDGSPAEAGGLQQGDIIQYVDDTSVIGIELNDLVTMIKAMEDEFLLGVYRPELDSVVELTLWCGEVELDHVEEKMLEDGIGYIQLLEFSQSAVDQFEAAIETLQAQGMEKLVVDLRNNPGGLLTSVCDILEMIQPEGLIVYTEDKYGNREEFSSKKGDRKLDCPIAVLVNEYSASASEIFAGSIQDYELGPVVGTQTYGKGVVQMTYPLKDGGAFKLTVEKYFTAGGQDIDGNGITPDIVVEESTEESTEESAEESAEGIGTDSEEEGKASGEAVDAEEVYDAVLQAAVEALNE